MNIYFQEPVDQSGARGGGMPGPRPPRRTGPAPAQGEEAVHQRQQDPGPLLQPRQHRERRRDHRQEPRGHYEVSEGGVKHM